MAGRLKLELLGGCRLTLDGKVLEVPFAKSRALLVYLAVTGSTHSREELTNLLWSEYAEGSARTSLRVRLSGLRRVLSDHLQVNRDLVSLHPESAYELDITSFLEALRTPDDIEGLRKAAKLYRGNFLEGFHVANAPAFEEWLMGQREALRRCVLEALQRLATHYETCGDYVKAGEDLARLLTLDPWREAAHRQLMRVYALKGQREAAVTQYLSCCRVLADELGLEPDAATTELYEKIRLGEVGGLTIKPPVKLSQPIAERRQLTVMSCELLGLSAFSDPEELHERLVACQQIFSESIARFEGVVAQRQGPLVTTYFGYPLAHEDDARRAVHAALVLQESLYKSQFKLKLRVGIHTGIVVVSGDGAGMPEVVGLTPVAAQSLQRLSKPNEILVSGATERLIHGYFEVKEQGSQLLEGLAEPLEVYQIGKVTAARSRLQIAAPKTGMVGRADELSELGWAWQEVAAGHGQTVLLNGEAGIGKSRLLHAFKEEIAGALVHWLESHCSAYQVTSPFYPVVSLIEHELNFGTTDTPETKLDKLEAALLNAKPSPAETIPLLAALLSLPYAHRYPPLHLSAEQQRQKTLTVLTGWLTSSPARRLTVLVLEDLHWCDPSTLELLRLLVTEMASAHLLILLTARPEFDVEWANLPNVRQIRLDSLSLKNTTALINQLTLGANLPAGVLEQLIVKSDGVPLFIEELTKGMLESEWMATRSNATSSVIGHVPSTLQDALTARLDRLGAAKEVAQLASVIGRDFALDLLAATSSVPAPVLEHFLRQLVDAELVNRDASGSHYSFKHALVQDAAYTSLLRSQRQTHHACVATVLSERFSGTAEKHPELLAQHYAAAGLPSEAIRCWQEAASRALGRSALQEAIHHFNAALKILADVPETSQLRELKLTLLLGLGSALHVSHGYAAADVEAVYRQARELCATVKTSPQRFDALLGLAGYYAMRAQYPTAEELVQQMSELPKALLSPLHIGQFHFMASRVAGFQGKLEASLSHANRILNVPDPLLPPAAKGTSISPLQDQKAMAQGYAATVLWLLGYPDQSLAYIDADIAYTRRSNNPYMKASALIYAAMLYVIRFERQKARKHLETFMFLAREQILTSWLAHGQVCQGALQVDAGHSGGLTLIREGLERFDAQGTVTHRPLLLSLYASALHQIGQLAPALTSFDEAIAQATKTGEQWWNAELYRLRGELLIAMDDLAAGEGELRRAVKTAKAQEAKSLELRATVSLARLLQKRDEPETARLALSKILGWFSEGFKTRDLTEAEVLLNSLSR